MSAVRQFSLSAPGQDHEHRQNSISGQDMPHVARVKSTVAQDAAKAAISERSMTLREGLKLYPKAVAWSVLISTCIVMEGFDVFLINSLYDLPAFQQRFGSRQEDGTYQISVAWQFGLSNGALVGEINGLMMVGYLAERFGYKKTLISALTLVIGFIFMLFFAQNLTMLLVEKSSAVSHGVPSRQVCPLSLRAYLTTYVNLCWVFGQFLASGVLKGVATKTGPSGYKLPYGLQWIWSLPLILVIALAPESP